MKRSSLVVSVLNLALLLCSLVLLALTFISFHISFFPGHLYISSFALFYVVLNLLFSLIAIRGAWWRVLAILHLFFGCYYLRSTVLHFDWLYVPPQVSTYVDHQFVVTRISDCSQIAVLKPATVLETSDVLVVQDDANCLAGSSFMSLTLIAQHDSMKVFSGLDRELFRDIEFAESTLRMKFGDTDDPLEIFVLRDSSKDYSEFGRRGQAWVSYRRAANLIRHLDTPTVVFAFSDFPVSTPAFGILKHTAKLIASVRFSDLLFAPKSAAVLFRKNSDVVNVQERNFAPFAKMVQVRKKTPA